MTALLAYALFVVVCFGWRTWQQIRRTGDAGFRGFRGGPVAKAAGALFLLGTVGAPMGPITVLRGRSPLGHITMLAVLGAVLVLAGLLLTVAAQRTMGASWRIGVDAAETTALVTRGPFARIRNPIFTGILLVIGGMALLAPTVLGVLALVSTWVGVEMQVRGVEEPYLRRTHGDEYGAYLRRTGRFLPGLRG